MHVKTIAASALLAACLAAPAWGAEMATWKSDPVPVAPLPKQPLAPNSTVWYADFTDSVGIEVICTVPDAPARKPVILGINDRWLRSNYRIYYMKEQNQAKICTLGRELHDKDTGEILPSEGDKYYDIVWSGCTDSIDVEYGEDAFGGTEYEANRTDESFKVRVDADLVDESVADEQESFVRISDTDSDCVYTVYYSSHRGLVRAEVRRPRAFSRWGNANYVREEMEYDGSDVRR